VLDEWIAVRQDHSSLAPDLSRAVTKRGVASTLEGRSQLDAHRRVIASRRDFCSCTVDHAGWVVTLHSPEEHLFLLEDARGSPRLVSGLADGEGDRAPEGS
jgi:hypothetical protein